DEAYGRRTEPQRDEPIVGCRAPAALQMAEHDGARLVARQLRELPGDPVGNAAVAGLGARLRLLDEACRAVPRHRALGDHHDGETAPTLVAPTDLGGDTLDVVRNLGDQDHVRTAAD